MENKKNIKAIDILKESLKVFAKNPNFIFFTALTSLPLFLFSLYFQTLFQTFLLQASQTLQEQAKSLEYPHRIILDDLYEVQENATTVLTRRLLTFDVATVIPYIPQWLRPLDVLRYLSGAQSRELLYLGFLYLAPMNLLRLVTVVPTVDLASKLYREERDEALTFNDMLSAVKRLGGERLKGTLVTFLYVVAFSSFSLVGFVWLLLTYLAGLSYFLSEYDYLYSYIAPFRGDMCFHALHGSNLALLSGIYLVWGAIWNLGLVVSVLEGRYGTRAFGSSGYLCLRNVHNGVVLMLVFSIWELAFRVPWWLSLAGYKAWLVIVAQTGLFCLGNAVKWVGFVVYFDSCIKRLFVKKVDDDVEQG